MKFTLIIAAAMAFTAVSSHAMSDTDLADIRARVMAKYPQKALEMIEGCKDGVEEKKFKVTQPITDADAFCQCWAKRTYESNADISVNALREKRQDAASKAQRAQAMEAASQQAATECNR